MVVDFSSMIGNLDFYSFLMVLYEGDYFKLLFPFMLSFSVLYIILSRISLFQHKKTKKPITSVILIISIVVSFYGVSFKTSEGHSVGELISVMFPNISAITIGILTLYILGAIFGKNFFSGLLQKKYTAFIYIGLGAIGLGSVIFYVGVALGFWDYSYFDSIGYWNVIVGVILLIMGIVFILIDIVPIGIMFLIIFGLILTDSGSRNVLDYFVDPVIFITFIIILLFSWVTSDSKSKEEQLALKILDREKSDYFNKGLKPFESRINDISDQNYIDNIKKGEKLYGKNFWKKYK